MFLNFSKESHAKKKATKNFASQRRRKVIDRLSMVDAVVNNETPSRLTEFSHSLTLCPSLSHHFLFVHLRSRSLSSAPLCALRAENSSPLTSTPTAVFLDVCRIDNSSWLARKNNYEREGVRKFWQHSLAAAQSIRNTTTGLPARVEQRVSKFFPNLSFHLREYKRAVRRLFAVVVILERKEKREAKRMCEKNCCFSTIFSRSPWLSNLTGIDF